MSPRRALLSVYRKEGIVDLARGLVSRGFEILSTGGTAAELDAAGVPVTGVSKATGFPEILDGRVKTLHPRVHAGILARRDEPTHMAALAEHAIPTIDVVVVNLYPFEEKVAKGCSFDEAVENVDIGGPSMVRSAAKNFRHVAVVVDPADYGLLLEQLDRPGGIDAATRLFFAQKAFRAHRPLRRRDRRLLLPGRGARRGLRARGDRRDLPVSPEPHLREGPGPALRREPAPARRVLQRPRLDPLLGGGRAQAAGQGALLQQHPRPGRRLAAGDRARGSGLRDRQAHEPLRDGARLGAARGLRARVVLRPGLGLRRHRRLQRAARRGDRAEDERAVRRGGDRARLREGGARRARQEDEPARDEHGHDGSPQGHRLRPAAGDGRAARAAVGPAPPGAGALRGGHQARAVRRRSGRPCSSPGPSSST